MSDTEPEPQVGDRRKRNDEGEESADDEGGAHLEQMPGTADKGSVKPEQMQDVADLSDEDLDPSLFDTAPVITSPAPSFSYAQPQPPRSGETAAPKTSKPQADAFASKARRVSGKGITIRDRDLYLGKFLLNTLSGKEKELQQYLATDLQGVSSDKYPNVTPEESFKPVTPDYVDALNTINPDQPNYEGYTRAAYFTFQNLIQQIKENRQLREQVEQSVSIFYQQPIDDETLGAPGAEAKADETEGELPEVVALKKLFLAALPGRYMSWSEFARAIELYHDHIKNLLLGNTRISDDPAKCIRLLVPIKFALKQAIGVDVPERIIIPFSKDAFKHGQEQYNGVFYGIPGKVRAKKTFQTLDLEASEGDSIRVIRTARKRDKYFSKIANGPMIALAIGMLVTSDEDSARLIPKYFAMFQTIRNLAMVAHAARIDMERQRLYEGGQEMDTIKVDWMDGQEPMVFRPKLPPALRDEMKKRGTLQTPDKTGSCKQATLLAAHKARHTGNPADFRVYVNKKGKCVPSRLDNIQTQFERYLKQITDDTTKDKLRYAYEQWESNRKQKLQIAQTTGWSELFASHVRNRKGENVRGILYHIHPWAGEHERALIRKVKEALKQFGSDTASIGRYLTSEEMKTLALKAYEADLLQHCTNASDDPILGLEMNYSNSASIFARVETYLGYFERILQHPLCATLKQHAEVQHALNLLYELRKDSLQQSKSADGNTQDFWLNADGSYGSRDWATIGVENKGEVLRNRVEELINASFRVLSTPNEEQKTQHIQFVDKTLRFIDSFNLTYNDYLNRVEMTSEQPQTSSLMRSAVFTSYASYLSEFDSSNGLKLARDDIIEAFPIKEIDNPTPAGIPSATPSS